MSIFCKKFQNDVERLIINNLDKDCQKYCPEYWFIKKIYINLLDENIYLMCCQKK